MVEVARKDLCAVRFVDVLGADVLERDEMVIIAVPGPDKHLSPIFVDTTAHSSTAGQT